jgi:hypothetical protein
MKDEVLSLNGNEIDVELLEQRVEMSGLVPVLPADNPPCGGVCDSMTCGVLICYPR